ncbi:DUF664 domain-containing protein [Frankia sp. AgB1.9]|nr:DUF664 domain-containing protein [Frankia sp. AgW1.1]MBL7547725.1 DUF664 domain-containing protein [Frankia sp. AgB1.9]
MRGRRRRAFGPDLDGRSRFRVRAGGRGVPTVSRRLGEGSLRTDGQELAGEAAGSADWAASLLGLDESACDGYATGDDGSFVVADGETLADVIAEFERASERSRVIAADFELDDTRAHPRAGDVSLRSVYLLLIEDFARHAGHGDILREQITAAR